MIQAASFGILSAFNSSMALSFSSIFAKSSLSLNGFSDSKKTPISQKPSSQNFPSKPTLELAKLEKRLSSSIQYLHGFSDGLNPLTSIADTLQELLPLGHPTSLNSPSYWKGRENGSQLGMFIDTAGMTGGTALMASSIQCATTTLGGCLPIAGPGAGAGLTALGLGTALMVSHSKNFEKSHAPPINENRSKLNTEKEAEELAKQKALETEDKEGGHSLARHGPEISKADLEKRLTSGVAPDGSVSPSAASTKFKSYRDWMETRETALKVIQEMEGIDLSKGPLEGKRSRYDIVIDHQRDIGNGFIGDVKSKRIIQSHQTGQKLKIFTELETVDKISRTKTRIEWNPSNETWEMIQHYPDLNSWNGKNKSYTEPSNYVVPKK